MIYINEDRFFIAFDDVFLAHCQYSGKTIDISNLFFFNIYIEQSLGIFYLVVIKQYTYEADDFDSLHMHRTHVITAITYLCSQSVRNFIPNEIRFLLIFQLSFLIPKPISKFN